MPRHRLPFVHLCDALVHPPYSLDDLLHTGRAERLSPGEGQIDLAAILRAIAADTPLALEVPMTALSLQSGAEAVAKRAITAARAVVRTMI